MKKVMFTVAGVSVICACGLVIDPDKLVEGNGSEQDSGLTDVTVTEASAEDAETDGGIVIPDAALDGPEGGTLVVDVPECVPVKPAAATEGPYAVVFGSAAAPTPACPTGYLASPVAVAKTDFEPGSVVCGDPSACTCAAPVGSPTCGFTVRSYDDSQCTNFADTPFTVGTACTDIDSENYYKLEYKIDGVTCTVNGPATTTPTSKPTPTYKTQYVVCAPDPNVTLAQCKGGQVGLPQAANASACVVVPTNVTCAGTSYEAFRFLSKAGTFTDTRTCNCGCGASQSSCTGGSVTTYNDDFGCTANPSALDLGVCRARLSADKVKAVLPTPAAAACSNRATPGGQAQATIDMKLCCLGTSGGG